MQIQLPRFKGSRLDIGGGRPGGLTPMMIPVSLKNQASSSSVRNDVFINPVGKTLVGGTQWAYTVGAVDRPGLARPLIKAKEDTSAEKK